MRTLLRAVFEFVVPDNKGQRAFEETLADWRHARSLARTQSIRLWIDTQGAVSLVRVLAMVTAAQLGDRYVWGPFASTVAASAVVSFALTLPILLSAPMPASPADCAILALMLMPAAVAVLFPLIAAIGLGVRRHHAVPLAGQIVLAAVFAVMLTGWIVPAGNHAYMLRVLEILEPSGGAKRLVSGPSDSSLPVLIADLRSDRPGAASGAARQLRIRAALTFGAPTFLVLGFAVRRRWMRRGALRSGQVAAVVAAVSATACGFVMAKVTPPPGRYPEQTSWVTGGVEARLWLTLAAAWAITALVLRRGREAPSTKHEAPST